MKKIVSICFTFLIIFPLFCGSVFAKNNVSKMDIEAKIHNDGSANITQVWDGSFTEGTENYIPINHSDGLTLTDFHVSDRNGEYEYVENWDIDANFEEKANKYGLVETEKGYELCWGITENGKNHYVIKYQLDGVVGSYTNSDGFNFCFVNANMNIFPTDVNLTIVTENGIPLQNGICKIWGFGFDGQTVFNSGKILAYTQKPLQGDIQSMTVMVEFIKGMLHPTRTVNDSFETVKNFALKDSSYSPSQKVSWSEIALLFRWFVVFIMIVIASASILVFIQKRKLSKLENLAGHFRNIPNKGDLNVTYKLGNLFEQCDKESIIGSVILRLIEMGCLIPLVKEKNRIDEISKKIVDIQLVKPPLQGNKFDKSLYSILEQAVEKDKILKEKELEIFCKYRPELLREFIDNSDKDGSQSLMDQKCFSNGISGKLRNLTENGKIELMEIIGFKHYLLDHSSIREGGIEGISLLGDYMIYAVLFGIAEKAIEQMKQVYPNNISQYEEYERNIYAALHCTAFICLAIGTAELYGGGGSGGISSIGGGGGFSGGDFGGGSR